MATPTQEAQQFRRVCFVDKILVPFSGNIHKNAFCTGDVDNDGEHELVVGTMKGELIIYKGNCMDPWKTCTGLGNITCIAIGDLKNDDKNTLVVMTAIGECFIFDFSSSNGSKSPDHTASTLHDNDSDNKGEIKNEISPGQLFPSAIITTLPDNVCTMLIEDIDGDGSNEFVLGRTDRELHIFRVAPCSDGPRIFLQQEKNINMPQQITAMFINYSSSGKPTLIVGQPGDSYMSVNPHATVNRKYPLTFEPALPAEIVGNIKRKDSKGTLFALAASDGMLSLMKDGCSLWTINIKRRVISMVTADITGDGNDEIVACTWDGLTFIIDYEGRVVTFQMEDSVSVFNVGKLTFNGITSTCFFYATFSEEIIIYRNINLEHMEVWDLHKIVDMKTILATDHSNGSTTNTEIDDVVDKLTLLDWSQLAATHIYSTDEMWKDREKALKKMIKEMEQGIER